MISFKLLVTISRVNNSYLKLELELYLNPKEPSLNLETLDLVAAAS